MFSTVSAPLIARYIEDNRIELIRLIEETYLAHDNEQTVNPNSVFLRFPDKPISRIIALPAFISGENAVAGIKWISSFPSNRAIGLPRASAVLILNDCETGLPYACMEGSQISLARTAASAASAALALTPKELRDGDVAVIGAGPISRETLKFLAQSGWPLSHVRVHDVDDAAALSFEAWAKEGVQASISIERSCSDATRGCSLVIFATSAASPHVVRDIFSTSAPTVLHISLRDLHPETILGVQNITDDISHVLRANTSLDLAQQLVGHHDFLDVTLADILSGRKAVSTTLPRVFSPFGLGILDVAVGQRLFQWAKQHGSTLSLPDFFPDTSLSSSTNKD